MIRAKVEQEQTQDKRWFIGALHPLAVHISPGCAKIRRGHAALNKDRPTLKHGKGAQ